MSDLKSFLLKTQEILLGHRDGKVNDQDFIDLFESLMADELPDELDQSGPIYKLLDDYLTEFSFFQNDPIIRNEHPEDLYGSDELNRKAQALLEKVQQLITLQDKKIVVPRQK